MVDLVYQIVQPLAGPPRQRGQRGDESHPAVVLQGLDGLAERLRSDAGCHDQQAALRGA